MTEKTIIQYPLDFKKNINNSVYVRVLDEDSRHILIGRFVFGTRVEPELSDAFMLKKDASYVIRLVEIEE